MRVALIQMLVVPGDVDGNRGRGLRMAAEAAGRADVVVLPEIWTTGYALGRIGSLAESEDGETISGVINIARQYSALIVAGSLPLRRGNKVYNSTVVIGPAGEFLAWYDKLHLFSMLREEQFFTAGDKRGLFELGAVNAGLALCYELRFPELFRSLALDGAQVIFVPAEWPGARAEHWLLLTRARAVENQLFVCAANCVGKHRDNNFFGHSLIIGPFGEIIAEGDESEGIIYGDIDLGLVAKSRRAMKVWQDRRPEVYI